MEINIISQDNTTSKIYKIDVYRKSKKETREYNEMREENEQKVQEIFNEQIEDYNVDKTNLTVGYYKSNNEIIKCGILLSIFILIVGIIIIGKKLIKYKSK